MIKLNPVVKSYERLPSSAAIAFFKHVAPEHKSPTSPSSASVYKVIEDTSGGADEARGGSWRGGWAKRFIPDTITYETSLEARPDGMVTITHAPMGVNSVTIWVVREGKQGGGVELEKTGIVTSNMMLMGFIKTTLQESYDKIVRDFVAALEKEVAQVGNVGDVEKGVASTGEAEKVFEVAC